MAERLLVGVVVGAQGLGGLLRVKSFTQDPADLAAYGPVDAETATGAPLRKLALKVTGSAKDAMIVRAAGVTDRTQAEALKGTRLYIDRDALPETEEDEYYASDLVGMDAVLADGTAIGKVRAVYDFGAGDVIEIEGQGASQMLSFTHDTVPEIDLEARRIVVVPPALSGDEKDAAREAADLVEGREAAGVAEDTALEETGEDADGAHP